MANKYNKKKLILSKPKVCKVPPPPPPPPTVDPNLLFWDQFNDAPNTLITAHLPDYDILNNGWDIRNGNVWVTDTYAWGQPGTAPPRNQACCNLQEKLIIIYDWVHTGSAQQTIGILLTTAASGRSQRVVDIYPGGKKIRAMTWTGSSWSTTRQFTESSLALNSDFLISVRCDGTQQYMRLDAGPWHPTGFTYVTPPIWYPGIYCNQYADWRHKEFRVERNVS